MNSQRLQDREPFWTVPVPELMASLDADRAGLTAATCSERLARVGPNLPRARAQGTLILEFLGKFRNPLVLLLLAAGAVAAFTGDPASFVIIAAIVLGSVLLDFVQERRAGRAAERLRESVALRARALRDGHWGEVPAAQLVPGDIVRLAAGDLVPADARLLEARDLFVNQAVLTGEAYPAEKQAGESSGAASDLSTASNAVFMGTSVLTGSATVLVCRTGVRTVLGGIANTLTARAPLTAFERGTRQFGLLIMRLTVLLALFVLLVNTLFHRPWLETFLFSVALAVGLTPELLPMIVSVTLSRGALRMSHKQVIVKRLAAIQNLGSMEVLCTDKTGTLTQARIRLERHVDPLGGDSTRVLELAYLNSFFETGLRSPLDEAILAHEEIGVGGWRKIDEMPFGFERRRVSVLVDDGQRRLLVVKGAPEDILRLSTHYQSEDETVLRLLDEAAAGRIIARFEQLAREGFRVLAVAWREVPANHEHALVDDETELVLAGFAAFLDPPKPSARAALQALSSSRVAVKILTGDNELVTRHLCESIGLHVDGVLTGAEIAHLDDQGLAARVEQANLFCRVSPAQKSRILLALKQRGHVVGFLGDGVNDAPSLHTADVGISVDSAVDVAKEAADLILLEQDLAVLHEGVREGRRTFANVMKYIMMATSSNFGNMFSMAAASLFLPFLPMLPIQILLNNLLYDASEVPIPLDTVDEERLARPAQWDMGFIRRFMLVVGPVSSLFDLLTFAVLIVVFEAGEALFHTGWFVESVATQVLVIFIIRTRRSPAASRPHPALTATSLAVVALAAALPFCPLSEWLGFVPPPWQLLPTLGALVLGYLLCAEWVKRRFYAHFVPAAG